MTSLAKLSIGATMLLPLLVVAPGGSARAAGPVHGARASGMGTAFVAVADDPSAMAYNPAGLTQLAGTHFYAGVAPTSPSTTFRDPSGGEESTRLRVFPVPHLYAVSDLGTTDLRVGLGVFSPFGIGGRTWDADGLTRYLSTESGIATLWINPTLAYRVLPGLSVAAGLDYMRSWNTATRRVDQSSVGAPDAQLDLDASGGGWGYNVGLLFSPTGALGFGFAYRSGIDVTHHGDARLGGIAAPLQGAFGGAEFSTDVRMPVSFPAIVSLGVAWRPTPAVILAADAEQVRWSSFRTATLDLEREIPEAGFTDAAVPLNWRNAWSAKGGAEWRVQRRVALRAGYAYVQTPTRGATLDPGNPDANLHVVSAGAGLGAGAWVLDAFYGAGIYEKRTVENTILSGTYSNYAHFSGVSFGWRWGGSSRPRATP